MSKLIENNQDLTNKNRKLLQQAVECKMSYGQLEKTIECRNDFDATNDEIERIARELEKVTNNLLDKGNAKYLLGKVKEAIEWWTESAKNGNKYAQSSLGHMYSEGEGVKQDYLIAIQWYQKSAEQGFPEAQNKLGNMYFEGEGVKQDYLIAIQWYQKAAEQGFPAAQTNLAYMYSEGKGAKQDYQIAIQWYQKAAEQGLPQAQKALPFLKNNH